MSSKAQQKSGAVVGSTHRQAAAAFMDGHDGPFRRQQLAQAIYPRTTPRSRERADDIARLIMLDMFKAGTIQRHGHLHWVEVSKKRVLKSGRTVAELSETTKVLSLDTRCPQKWAAVDMETGEIWVGSASGWRRATEVQGSEVVACLKAASPGGERRR